jgi:hypothetical protein
MGNKIQYSSNLLNETEKNMKSRKGAHLTGKAFTGNTFCEA